MIGYWIIVLILRFLENKLRPHYRSEQGYWINVLILRFLENELTPQVGTSPFYVTAFHDGVDGLRLDYLEVMINFVK